MTDPRSILTYGLSLKGAIPYGPGIRPEYTLANSGSLIPGSRPMSSARSTDYQGSVLAVRVFGSLSTYFTPQPEVVPIN